MQICTNNLKASGIKVLSLLILITSTAVADEKSYNALPYDAYLLLAEQGNPWALPEKPKQPDQLNYPPRYLDKYQGDAESGARQPSTRSGWHNQQRFVTPEILDSLKRQQSQMQRVPQQYGYYQRPMQQRPMQQRTMPFMTMPQPSYPSNPASSFNNMRPPSSMEFANPMYDIPSVSPWGDGPDIMYRGQSMPWVPDEAIGGIPPMSVSPYFDDGSSGYTDSADMLGEEQFLQQEEAGKPGENEYLPQENVFNPFTFIPNRNLQ